MRGYYLGIIDYVDNKTFKKLLQGNEGIVFPKWVR